MKNNVVVSKRQNTKYILLLTLLFACLVAVLACLGKYVGDYLAYKNSWQAHASFEFEKLEDEVDENGNTVACYGVSTPAQLIGAIMQSSKTEQRNSNSEQPNANVQAIAKWDDNASSSDGITYKLTQDIDFSGETYTWSMLNFGAGEMERPEVLDGCGYTIKNLTINLTKDAAFVYCNYGTIKNLIFENLNVYTTSRLAAGMCIFNEQTISGCNIKSGSITCNNFDGIAGGIVCRNTGFLISDEIYLVRGRIENCTNSASVTADNMAGGIVAQNTADVIECHNFGTITATGNNQKRKNTFVPAIPFAGSISNPAVQVYEYEFPPRYAGGIAANFQGPAVIANCINYGTVFAEKTSEGAVVGGIAGYIRPSPLYPVPISTCASLGDVKADVSGSCVVGGIAGYISGRNNYEDPTPTVKIEKCYNSAKLQGRNYDFEAGVSIVGGLVSVTDEVIEILNCCNLGEVISYSNVVKTEPVKLSDGTAIQTIYRDTSKVVNFNQTYRVVVPPSLNSHEDVNMQLKGTYQNLSNIELSYSYHDNIAGGLIGMATKDFVCTNSYSKAIFNSEQEVENSLITVEYKDKITYNILSSEYIGGDYVKYNCSFKTLSTINGQIKPRRFNLIYGDLDSKVSATLNNVFSSNYDNSIGNQFNYAECNGIIYDPDYKFEHKNSGTFDVKMSTSFGMYMYFSSLYVDYNDRFVNLGSLQYVACPIISDFYGSLNISLGIYCDDYSYSGPTGNKCCAGSDLCGEWDISIADSYYDKNPNVTEKMPTAEELGADVWMSNENINNSWPILKDFYWIYA